MYHSQRHCVWQWSEIFIECRVIRSNIIKTFQNKFHQPMRGAIFSTLEVRSALTDIVQSFINKKRTNN